jgi:hypothetical protein
MSTALSAKDAGAYNCVALRGACSPSSGAGPICSPYSSSSARSWCCSLPVGDRLARICALRTSCHHLTKVASVSLNQEKHHPLPVVTPDGLHGPAGQGRIALDSAAWFAWLDGSDAFVYTTSAGAFTVRRERRGAGAGFWRAAKKQAGRLRRIYLGQTPSLTAERLADVAQLLFAVPPHVEAGVDLAGRHRRRRRAPAPPRAAAAPGDRRPRLAATPPRQPARARRPAGDPSG